MCGIMGYVGTSKDPELTHRLATQLLVATQSRGRDATGFYALDDALRPQMFKRDVFASQFVKLAPWETVRGMPVLIGHCRATTNGSERNNINNHPHVSDDNSLAVVHNGIVSSFRSIAARNRLTLKSECDTEVLLRLIESKPDPLAGIQLAIAESGYGSAACLVVKVDAGVARVFAYKDGYMPVSVIDLREPLGQLFFASTPDLFRTSARVIGLGNDYIDAPVKTLDANEIVQVTFPEMVTSKFTATGSKRQQSYGGDDFYGGGGDYYSATGDPWWRRTSVAADARDEAALREEEMKLVQDEIREIQALSRRLRGLVGKQAAGQRIDYHDLLADLQSIKFDLNKAVTHPPQEYLIS